MSSTIILREYGAVVTDDLSSAEAIALREASDGKLNVEFGAKPGTVRITATSYVGAVVTPAVSVLVRPKVELHNLFYLLGVAQPEFRRSEFRFAADADLLSIMAVVFTQAVDAATARGVVRGYRHTEERLLAQRGRIDFVEQMRTPGMVSPIACRFDEYTADVFANRALLAALERLRRVPGLSPTSRTSLARLRQRFDEVAVVPISAEDVRRWVPNRLNQHYRPAMRLAELVLSNLSLSDKAGRFAAGSFFVDMNDLFQRFVADRLATYLAPTINVVEEPRVPLGVGGRLRMAPDLVMRRAGRDVYVGDVKYKLSRGQARMSDYYQLLAYTTAMSLDEGVLIYAQDPGDVDDPIVEELVHSVQIRNADKLLHVYRLPLAGSNEELEDGLRKLADWIAARTRFRQLRSVA